MKPIDKILQRTQRLQLSCFGTPISISIEASRGTERNKVVNVSICVDMHFEDSSYYLFDSSMTDEELYQLWGRLKDNASRLLDKHVGHKVTGAGNIRQ